ncbi:hypothetical protein Ancab_026212 [Ancistrocladus abbreviatus]
MLLCLITELLLISQNCCAIEEEAKQGSQEFAPVTLKVTRKQVSRQKYTLNVGQISSSISHSILNRDCCLCRYWDIVWSEPNGNVSDDIDCSAPQQYCPNEDPIVGSGFKIIKEDENQAEISFFTAWSSAVQNSSSSVHLPPLNIDRSSGFYSYAIFEREQGWPGTNIVQIRAVYKLQRDKFSYMALSDKIQRIMPMPQDRETGQPLAYKEAVLLTHPINPALKGEDMVNPRMINLEAKEIVIGQQVDDKYQYSCEDRDNRVHGWISFDPPIGFWLITPSNEFRSAGPFKQDLTSHVGPTTLAMLYSTHYTGKDLTMNFENGEPWKKVFGPFFVHLNSLSPSNDPHQLWRLAKKQMIKERNSWPYDFPLSADYPKSNQRGLVQGQLLLNDRHGKPISARSAWIGLAPPGEVGSWQREAKGFQFWAQADSKGNFKIRDIHEGTYSLYAWVPGFLGEYRHASDITISPGSQIKLGNLVYMPPRNGPTLWEIGIPDRSAAEFFVPEPRPNLTNRLYLHDEHDTYRQYGLWDRYTDLYPDHDLVYTIGISNYQKDWFFAHVPRKLSDSTYVATTWQIMFTLEVVRPQGKYTLQLALAAASLSEVQAIA